MLSPVTLPNSPVLWVINTRLFAIAMAAISKSLAPMIGYSSTEVELRDPEIPVKCPRHVQANPDQLDVHI